MDIELLINEKETLEKVIDDANKRLLVINNVIVGINDPFIIVSEKELVITDGWSYRRNLYAKSFYPDTLNNILGKIVNNNFRPKSIVKIYHFSGKDSIDVIEIGYNSETNDYTLICDLSYTDKKFKITLVELKKLVCQMIECYSRYQLLH